MPRNLYGPDHEAFRSSVQEFVERTLRPRAEQMLEVLSTEPALENTAADYAPRPDYRPVTKFERRGLRLGHGVWDLLFRRRATGPTV